MRLLLLIFALALAGCGSVQEHRIRQYPEQFAAFPEEEQEAIRKGLVLEGFTPLQVYLALGAAQNKEGEPPNETWIYLGGRDTSDFDDESERGIFRTRADLIFNALGQTEQLEVVFQNNRVVGMTYGPAEPKNWPDPEDPSHQRFAP